MIITQKEFLSLDHLLIIIIGNTEFSLHSKDWRKFEQNNKTIALNILYVSYNTKQIKQTCVSKYNNERDNRVNLLMITDGTSNWHYLTVKSISGLLRRITSNHNGDFYCLNCFHSYTTEKNLESMKEYVMITIFAI